MAFTFYIRTGFAGEDQVRDLRTAAEHCKKAALAAGKACEKAGLDTMAAQTREGYAEEVLHRLSAVYDEGGKLELPQGCRDALRAGFNLWLRAFDKANETASEDLFADDAATEINVRRQRVFDLSRQIVNYDEPELDFRERAAGERPEPEAGDWDAAEQAELNRQAGITRGDDDEDEDDEPSSDADVQADDLADLPVNEEELVAVAPPVLYLS